MTGTPKKRGRPPIGDRPMTAAERQHRRMTKLRSMASGIAPGSDASMPAGEAALQQLASQAAGKLITQALDQLREVASVFHEASDVLKAGKPVNKGKLQSDLRDRCRWLTDALEQLTQCAPTSRVKTVHTTFLCREAYANQAWDAVALICRDVSTSSAWEDTKASGIPDLIRRGVAAFRGIGF